MCVWWKQVKEHSGMFDRHLSMLAFEKKERI
jgi:hypothetical protein